MSNEFYMKGKEVDLGSSDGKFDTVYINIQDWNEIQKKLQVLEIIKSKRIDVDLFFDTSSYGGLEEYNEYCCEWAELNREQYNLLKEVLL